MSRHNGNGRGGDGKSGGMHKSGIRFVQKPRARSADKPFAFESDDRPRLQQPRAEKQSQPQHDMRLGEFTVERMGHDGRGISQWNGKTLFIDGAITGERISARLVQEHSRYAEARVDKLIESSPLRVEPPCQHYQLCGGCQVQHINTDTQLASKQQVVLDQLERWGGVKPKHLLPPITSPSANYRRNARLAVWYDTSGVTLGFRKRNSHELVQIDDCIVLVQALNVLLAPLKNWLVSMHSAEAVTHIELIDTDDRAAVVIRHTKKLAQADLQHLADLAAERDIDIWLQGSDAHQLQDLHGQPADPRLAYHLPEFDMTLAFHPQDFIQVNSTVNRQMVAQAVQMLGLKGDERVLDLFCGVGNFTLPLARHCREVIGIEAVDDMVAHGRENAAHLGIRNATFVAANLSTLSERRLHATCGKIDAILLDPPRDGAKEIVAKLAQLSPKRMVYVSCNPATLARDAKILAAAGYQLDSVGVMDMFPHTAHIESMALFVRR